MKRYNKEIIGGADGPTSVFIVEKNGKIKGLRLRIKNFFYRRKQDKAKAMIIANPHTIQEVVQYIQEKYGAVEMSSDSYEYQWKYESMRSMLILQHKPELLGDLQEIKQPDEFNENSAKEFLNQVQEREKRIAMIPEDVFSIDLHIYEINISQIGTIECVLEMNWNEFSCSYRSPKKKNKQLEKISQDIYQYYGVSVEDIKNKTDRYQRLVMALSS